MKRREFVALVGGAAMTWPLAGRAQSDRVRRIGVLMSVAEGDPEGRACRSCMFGVRVERAAGVQDNRLSAASRRPCTVEKLDAITRHTKSKIEAIKPDRQDFDAVEKEY
jgi:hypothetical protein